MFFKFVPFVFHTRHQYHPDTHEEDVMVSTMGFNSSSPCSLILQQLLW